MSWTILDAHILFELAKNFAEIYPATTNDIGWIRLTHVCSSWRHSLLDAESAKAMARLWARTCGAFASEDAFTTLCERAGDEPLVLLHPTRLTNEHEHMLIHALASRLTLVGNLAICAHSYNWASLLVGKRLPHLFELSLEDPVPVSSDSLYEESFELIDPLIAPTLASVQLYGGRLLPLVAPALHTLVLTNIRTSTYRVLDLLRECPQLRHLTVNSGTLLSGTRPADALVYLPDLHSLTLCLHASVRRKLKGGMIHPANVELKEIDEVGSNGQPLVQAPMLPLIMMNHLAPGEEPVELPPYSLVPP